MRYLKPGYGVFLLMALSCSLVNSKTFTFIPGVAKRSVTAATGGPAHKLAPCILLSFIALDDSKYPRYSPLTSSLPMPTPLIIVSPDLSVPLPALPIENFRPLISEIVPVLTLSWTITKCSTLGHRSVMDLKSFMGLPLYMATPFQAIFPNNP